MVREVADRLHNPAPGQLLAVGPPGVRVELLPILDERLRERLSSGPITVPVGIVFLKVQTSGLFILMTEPMLFWLLNSRTNSMALMSRFEELGLKVVPRLEPLGHGGMRSCMAHGTERQHPRKVTPSQLGRELRGSGGTVTSQQPHSHP